MVNVREEQFTPKVRLDLRRALLLHGCEVLLAHPVLLHHLAPLLAGRHLSLRLSLSASLSLPPCLGCLETLISLRDSESATTGVLSSSSSSRHSDRVRARRADRNNFWFVVGQFADLGTLLR